MTTLEILVNIRRSIAPGGNLLLRESVLPQRSSWVIGLLIDLECRSSKPFPPDQRRESRHASAAFSSVRSYPSMGADTDKVNIVAPASAKPSADSWLIQDTARSMSPSSRPMS